MTEPGEILAILERLYDPAAARDAHHRIRRQMAAMPAPATRPAAPFSQSDAVLITYADSLRSAGRAPLEVLRRFAAAHLREAFSHIHLLPFFPYSSDDGFSVIDFHTVNPALGSWADVAALGRDFRLMVDWVLNHVSAESPWFSSYLAGRPGFRDLAIEVVPGTDLSAVVRPRAQPLTTRFVKADGTPVDVWTTFGADQIDLNYASVDVLDRMIGVVLDYVRRGAKILRLDAVAYLWKTIGTASIHLPQTHDVIRLVRCILDQVAPEVMILTETNVPHAENIAYFGDGRNEAQMVYNFSLPPLLFHAFATGDATVLSDWAETLRAPSDQTTFFNFTASHDGIGLRPLEGLLPPRERDRLVDIVQGNGGRISYRTDPDGTVSPYELNITYVDAMRRPGDAADPWHRQRFLASQCLPLALAGVPAVYIHSLLGSRNWLDGLRQSGRARTINRRPLDAEAVEAEIARDGGFRAGIFHPLRAWLKLRRKQAAFHPNAGMTVLRGNPAVFALRRTAPEQAILALVNVGDRTAAFDLGIGGIAGPMTDLISGRSVTGGKVSLSPYRCCWLAAGLR